tara:strand:+ start:907 stop:2106 length:1200 start_codon:yes stop_codon:yes gene_type:complete
MSYIGIGSPIPDLSSLPGQTGGEVEVNLSYPSAGACTADSNLTPTFSPVGGSFTSSPTGLVVNSSTGVIDISASTIGSYTITYTVEGIPSSFAFALNQTNDSSFSYSSSSFEKTGTATPNITGVSGGTFAASSGLSIDNSTGVIDLAASTIGTYTVSYTSPGVCGTISTFQLSIEAVNRTLANSFSMSFDGVDSYIEAPITKKLTGTATIRTFSFWVKTSSTETFLSFFSDVGGGNFRYTNNFYFINSSQKLLWSLDSSPTFGLTICQAITTNTVNINDGNWHHIVLYNPVDSNANRADISNTKIYVDGVSQALTTNVGTANIRGMRSGNLAIGAGFAGSKNYLNGKIDEFAYWDNIELTSGQVQEIYNLTNNNTGKTANLNKLEYTTTNPTAWYRMGD